MNKVFSFILILCCHLFSFGQIKLPRLISDGMILQREAKVKVWGWASANEEITLSFKGERYKAVAGNTGKWEIQLTPQKICEPFEMIFKGKNEVRVKNVLFGDVWVCSGQSNMEITMDRVKDKYADIIQNAENANIRQFIVPDEYDFNQPNEDLKSGEWKMATPQNILSFSAVAYFFARELYEKHKIPIGLINTALGGSPAEAWLSEEAIKQFPDYDHEAQKFKNHKLIEQIEENDKNVSRNWHEQLNKNDEGLKKNWKTPLLKDSDWGQMEIPGNWSDYGLDANGSVWFRKMIYVPKSMTGKPAKLLLGRIVDADSVFINGSFSGSTSYQYPPRRYILGENILKEGENNITIRVINNSGKGGFIIDKPYFLIVGNDSISLKGNWKYKLGVKMNPLPEQTFVRWKPVGLYNSMIAPLINYSIKGIIWYQGEANTKKPSEYKELLEALVRNWRSKWNQGNIPFLYVQLANFMEAKEFPSESMWAQLRQKQLEALSIPRSGLIVTIDLGEWNDIHPLNKKDVGHRLALQANHLVYKDRATVFSGPVVKSFRIKNSKMVIKFMNVGSGLQTLGGGELRYFSIAGKDKKYVWAKASIIGKDKVIVYNSTILNPVSVRYAWADNPQGANLFNKENLPASPFEIPFKKVK